MDVKKIFVWTLKFIALFILYCIFFIIGSMAISPGLMPDNASEPGLVSTNAGLIIIALANTLLIIALILSSRWGGMKLGLLLAFAYYIAVTFLSQVETWFFLTNITVGEELLGRLFIMGLPVAFLYVPLAVWIVGKKQQPEPLQQDSNQNMPLQQWILKLGFISFLYLLVYWLAGYFIAWQNPELRAFYGSEGAITPFWEHTFMTLRHNPGLLLLQIPRGLLWTLCALPIIIGSKIGVWRTAILVGLFLSVPQNIIHILENPLMPVASIRLSHMIETASSNFFFGLIVVWIFHRRHYSFKDLFESTTYIKEKGKAFTRY